MKRKKIVFLDAATVDRRDIDLAPLRRLGQLVTYNTSQVSQVVSRSRDAQVVLTNKCVLGEREFAALPKLRLVCVAATGVNNIDLSAAAKHRVAVTNVAGYSTQTVAEHALLLLLALSHRLLDHHSAALSGQWSRSSHFSLLDFPYSDLAGKTLGVVGYGTIGRKVARLAGILGMKVRVAAFPGRRYPARPRRTPLAALLRRADFVTLHCPLTPETRHLINRKTLQWMKPSASLLNLARGPVVSEKDVAEALHRGRLRAYATDVLSVEPPPRMHPFFRRKIREKVLITPHIAWASRESRQRLMNEIATNISFFFRGQKRNRVV